MAVWLSWALGSMRWTWVVDGCHVMVMTCFFGVPGMPNGTNISDQSPLFLDLMQGKLPAFLYHH